MAPARRSRTTCVRRYFALADEVASLERDRPTDEAALDEKRGEQQRLENKVEDILERRLARVLEDEGLTTSLPLFSSVRFVFPPVDFEFDRPPTVLAISPRDEIHLQQAILLRSGLSVAGDIVSRSRDGGHRRIQPRGGHRGRGLLPQRHPLGHHLRGGRGLHGPRVAAPVLLLPPARPQLLRQQPHPHPERDRRQYRRPRARPPPARALPLGRAPRRGQRAVTLAAEAQDRLPPGDAQAAHAGGYAARATGRWTRRRL